MINFVLLVGAPEGRQAEEVSQGNVSAERDPKHVAPDQIYRSDFSRWCEQRVRVLMVRKTQTKDKRQRQRTKDKDKPKSHVTWLFLCLQGKKKKSKKKRCTVYLITVDSEEGPHVICMLFTHAQVT